jgi:hypothetical protein
LDTDKTKAMQRQAPHAKGVALRQPFANDMIRGANCFGSNGGSAYVGVKKKSHSQANLTVTWSKGCKTGRAMQANRTHAAGQGVTARAVLA